MTRTDGELEWMQVAYTCCLSGVDIVLHCVLDGLPSGRQPLLVHVMVLLHGEQGSGWEGKLKPQEQDKTHGIQGSPGVLPARCVALLHACGVVVCTVRTGSCKVRLY